MKGAMLISMLLISCLGLLAQRSNSFDIQSLNNDQGQSIYEFTDSVYHLNDSCTTLPKQSAFRLQIGESGTVLSVYTLFDEKNCRNRAYAEILYDTRWKLQNGQKLKYLYLIFEK